MNSFNLADIAVIVIIAVCVYFYYNKGLVLTLLGFCSTLISLFMSRFLSPVFADFLRKTPLFDSIKEYIGESIAKTGSDIENNIISSLDIPDFLKTAITDNSNNVIYDRFNVTNPKDYISEYIAGFVVNIIAMIIIFILLTILFRFLSRTLKIISRFPLIKTANKLGGGAVGFAQGVLIVWIGLAVLTAFYGKPMFDAANEAVANSVIASRFYDSNILIKGLSAINNLI